MIRFRWLPACVLALLMTAGICWAQKQPTQTAQSADTARLPYYYELVDVLFPATQENENNIDIPADGLASFSNAAEAQDDSADEADDDTCDDCCADCAAEWIPILVNDCLNTWALLWELGSYTEAANLADEAWRLDPCNIATMHARTLSHIALALNAKPTAQSQDKACNVWQQLSSEETGWQPAKPCCPTMVWEIKNLGMGCCGFGFTCTAATCPVAACGTPVNACGMACAHASGCGACCEPCKPTACGTCAGSTCAATDCCHEAPKACGTCAVPCAAVNSCGGCSGSIPCATMPCTPCCPASTGSTACSSACSTGPASCDACCATKCCTKDSCSCAKDCKCCSSKCSCAKDCKCCSAKCSCAKDCNCCSGKCCCAKNTCTCHETMRMLVEQIIALVKERENKPANVMVVPAGLPQPPMMGMPGMCVPPPPPPMAPNGQPVCMPGMPCPPMMVSRPVEAMPMPRPPMPPAPQWVVGEVLPNPPMIQFRKDDMKIHVTAHGKRIHVNCNTFDAACDHLVTCDGGERLVLEGNVRLTTHTGNKPGKVSAERVEVYVPEGSVELVPDSSTTEKPVEPVRYQCPVCPPPAYAVPN